MLTRRYYQMLVATALMMVTLFGCGREISVAPTEPEAFAPVAAPAVENAPGILIGPIEDFTTGWHNVDGTTMFRVPRGAALRFKYALPQGATIEWEGASEEDRDAKSSYAVCTPDAADELAIRVTVSDASGNLAAVNECNLRIVDVTPTDFAELAISLQQARPEVTTYATNLETMAAWFGPSIGDIVEVGHNHYRTAVGLVIDFSSNMESRAAGSLMEWRVNGKAVSLGRTDQQTLDRAGANVISVGPPSLAQEIRIDTYRVEIVSHEQDETVLTGTPVTYRAVTHPAGFENEIRWVASTKNGNAYPTIGKGAEFTTTFFDTFGPDNFQWLGVKAGNAKRGQDIAMRDLCDDLCIGCGNAKTDYQANIGTGGATVLSGSMMGGPAGQSAANLGELIEKICAAFDGTNKIDVFYVAHGSSGGINVGTGVAAGNATANNAGTRIGTANAAWFRDQIKNKVKKITLFGCSTGSGTDGQELLDTIAEPGLEAVAYDGTVCDNGTADGGFAPAVGSGAVSGN